MDAEFQTEALPYWSSSFEVDPADRDAMVEALTGVYTSGFEALRERFGA